MYLSTVALRFLRGTSGNRSRGGPGGVREHGALQVVKRLFLSCTPSFRTSFDPMVASSLLCDVVRGAKSDRCLSPMIAVALGCRDDNLQPVEDHRSPSPWT